MVTKNSNNNSLKWELFINMKKYILLYFLLFQFFSTFAQDKSEKSIAYRLTYVLDYKPDSTNLNFIKQDKFYLYVLGNNSKFISAKKIEKDSVLNKLTKENNLMAGISMQNRPKAQNEYIIYNINNTHQYVETIGINNYSYHINDSPKWSLLEEKIKVESFNCNVAETKKYLGRDWKVLYDTNTPLITGPYKFYNLPGLVIKAFDTKMHYVFTLQKIEKISDLKIEVTEDYKLLDKREILLNLKRNMLENPFSNLPSGIKIEIDPKQKKEIIERLKKNNDNPIELE